MRVRVRRAPSWQIDAPDDAHAKLWRAIELTARHLALGPLDARVEHWSDLDVAKGMGSSTADVVAGARAVAAAAGETLSARELAAIATQIEPSDGSMFDGVVAFTHDGDFVVRAYPWWPRFAIVMAIPPTTLRTESAYWPRRQDYASDYERMMGDLDAAARAKRGDVFAAVATQSALINQLFLVNPLFEVLRRESPRLGADGVVVGHTGTVSGLLFVLADEDGGAIVTGEGYGPARRARAHLATVLPSRVRLELATTPPSKET